MHATIERRTIARKPTRVAGSERDDPEAEDAVVEPEVAPLRQELRDGEPEHEQPRTLQDRYGGR